MKYAKNRIEKLALLFKSALYGHHPVNDVVYGMDGLLLTLVLIEQH